MCKWWHNFIFEWKNKAPDYDNYFVEHYVFFFAPHGFEYDELFYLKLAELKQSLIQQQIFLFGILSPTVITFSSRFLK